MQETLNSLVRLSAAMTVFGMQQVQTAVGSADTKESVDKLREPPSSMRLGRRRLTKSLGYQQKPCRMWPSRSGRKRTTARGTMRCIPSAIPTRSVAM